MFDVNLIYYKYGVFFLMFFDDIRIDMLFFGGNPDAVVDDKEDKVRMIYYLFDKHFFFCEIVQSWTIEKSDSTDVIDQSFMFNNISGGPRNVCHYRSKLAYQPVE